MSVSVLTWMTSLLMLAVACCFSAMRGVPTTGTAQQEDWCSKHAESGRYGIFGDVVGIVNFSVILVNALLFPALMLAGREDTDTASGGRTVCGVHASNRDCPRWGLCCGGVHMRGLFADVGRFYQVAFVNLSSAFVISILIERHLLR